VRVARLVLALCAALGTHAGAAQPSSGVAPPEGLLTYIGWRVFQAQCATCHAADARGSSFAPDLTERLRGMTEREFFAALDRGYLGSQSAMPPRGRDPNVAPYYEELWAYLVARREGTLPAGPVEPPAAPSAP
jgi:mono/diheme cytochrome c family protein